MLVWIDVETTGLVAAKCRLLEVACIVTDDALTEVARQSWVTSEARKISPDEWDFVDPYVREMHRKNGLWGESIGTEGSSLSLVNKQLEAFIRQHAPSVKDEKGRKIKPTLAGSTVSFDRGFLEVHAPESAAALGYRHLDVSSLTEMSQRVWPLATVKKAEKNAPHRAMPDIEASLASARHYAKALAEIGTLDACRELLDAVTDADISKLPDEVAAARLRYQHRGEPA